MKSRIDEIREFLGGDGEVLVVTHFFPDGDAVGSLLAFSGMLDQLGVEHLAAIDDAVPEKYAFLPGSERIRNLKREPLERKFKRMAILDAGALPRIGAAQDCIDSDTQILNIDHHLTGKAYGSLNLIDVNAAATAELLYDLCRELEMDFTPQIAHGLFVGILTDTGRFRFSNTTSRVLSICGELVGAGVDPGWVTENIYYNTPFELVRTLAKALDSIELHHDGLVCLISLDRGEPVSDTEGFVEYASSIRGVALAAFYYEMEPNLFKVSLRSRCQIDVSEVAREFGGGGHIKAAGFRFQGTAARLKDLLLEALDTAIRVAGLKPGGSFTEVGAPDDQEAAAWAMDWMNGADGAA